jgi:hypothetical protein
MADQNRTPQGAPAAGGANLASALESAGIAPGEPGVPGPSEPIDGEAQVQDTKSAMASVMARAQRPGELKWRLTSVIYPAILLIFLALYVSSLASGVEPEVALLRAGGAGLVLAVLARVAVGIIADETRLVLNDSQIVAMARTGAVREYLAKQAPDSEVNGASAGAGGPAAAQQGTPAQGASSQAAASTNGSSQAAPAGSTGGKE